MTLWWSPSSAFRALLIPPPLRLAA